MKRPNVIDEYASYLGYRCSKNTETAILANFETLTSSVSNSTLALFSTQLEKAFGILESYSVPKEECRMFLTPKTYWRDLMSIAKYYDASQFGRATLPFGVHDMLYGVPITLTANVTNEAGTGEGNAIIHPGAIGFAMFGPDITITQGEPLRKKVNADVMYGDVMIQKLWGVKLNSTHY